MPGDPQDVKATPINSTTIKVNWKPPLAKERNGVIRGYHIHVQEMKEEVGRQIFCWNMPSSMLMVTGKGAAE